MPSRKPTIPGTLKRSEPHAREVWEKTLESAMETYDEDEAAYRVAYGALKHQYKKEGDHWEPKERWGPSDEQSARGPDTRIKSTDPRTARTARGAVAGVERTKDDLMADAKRFGVSGRSRMNKEALAVAIHEAKGRRSAVASPATPAPAPWSESRRPPSGRRA